MTNSNINNMMTVALNNVEVPDILPVYARRGANPTTVAFVCVSDAVAKETVGVDELDFKRQLPDARNENAQLVGWLEGEGYTAYQFIGSYVPEFVDVANRHLFVPRYCLKDAHRTNRIFVAYFISNKPDKVMPTSARVVGWITSAQILAENKDKEVVAHPTTFNSSLDVISVCVSDLNPIEDLPRNVRLYTRG